MKQKNKEEAKNKIDLGLILIVVASIAVIIGGFLIYDYTSNVVKNNDDSVEDDFGFYNEDTCRCLEKNRPVCNLDGFEYNKTVNFCVNKEEKTFTYATRTCSKYECSGEVYEFSLESQEWSPR
ncbi:hypothetical protein HY448_02010 [Candidatus Pacearchaeota archaeon]|nr:hypothetical protein [Candidatus Pacearchaeota archaeon]